MAGLKSLAKDTAIYGLSSIIGRFLNYLLVPLYTVKLSAASGGYGVITNIYAITALLLIILTYGMETGFFRFINKGDKESMTVYSTTLISVGTTSALFILLCVLFRTPISDVLGYAGHEDYITMMATVVALDAFQCIPFAYLRYKKRPIKFAFVKLMFIIPNILLNLFFFVWCPWLSQHYPDTVSWFYDPLYGVGYAFLANLISTAGQMIYFIPELTGFKYRFDARLWKDMIKYSMPILVLGIVGVLNHTVDKIIFPYLLDDRAYAETQLGIYGAASKVAMVMAMFTQAFRYAYEPFVFGKNKDKDNKVVYANAMKFFIIFGLLAFLAVICYLDLLKFIIAPDYWEGLRVVPIVMASELFVGIYFNLSFWYKLIDQTKWGAYFSIIGFTIVIVLNIVLVPRIGYMACAWSSFIGYFIIMLLSYFVGQVKYPINYDLKGIFSYLVLAAVLYLIKEYTETDSLVVNLLVGTLLLILFVIYIVKRDFPLKNIPVINRFIKK